MSSRPRRVTRLNNEELNVRKTPTADYENCYQRRPFVFLHPPCSFLYDLPYFGDTAMSERLVTDLPIWEDFPFPGEVPSSIEVRRGKFDGDAEDVIVFWHPEKQKNVDMAASVFYKGPEEAIRIALRMIAGAIAYESKQPGDQT